MEVLASAQNPKIKAAAKLRDKSARKERGVFLVEGLRELEKALAADFTLKELYFCPDNLSTESKTLLPRLLKLTSQTFEVSPAAFAKLAVRESSDGLFAVFAEKQQTLASIKSANPLLVVLETVEKPGNLGAVLRTADGAGADAVIVLDPACDIYNPNVVRASLGTLFTVPTISVSSAAFKAFCKERGVKVVATTPHTDKFHYTADLKGPLAIMMGSEAFGLSQEWLDNADLKVKIPMEGSADSLNLSVAAAVLVYEAYRQRH